MRAQPTPAARDRRLTTTAAAAPGLADATPAAQECPDAQREQAVRETAYYFYLARGCVYGHELEDWLKAEAQVQQAPADVAPATPAAPTDH